MRHFTIKAIIGALALAALPAASASAQEPGGSKWYFGLGGGYHSTHMRFSDIDEDVFPDNKNMGSGVFSVFVQGEFGREGNFAVRPQLSFLTRGGKLTGIYSNTLDYELEGIDDIYYRLRSRYIDIRVPLIYQFGKQSSTVRPYLFVAPVLGFATAGNIMLIEEDADGTVGGYKTDISDANMASTYFAGQVGAGVKFAIPVAGDRCWLGIEASYEFGLTDTYGSKEKDSQANDLAQLFNRNYKIDGSRKFGGFEVQAVLSVPFSIFSKKGQPAPEPALTDQEAVMLEHEGQPVVAAPAPEPQPAEKPCYTLDEIIDLMAKNESIEGKTICAVDAITFDFSKSTIKPESYAYLDKLATTLIRSNRRIEVKGHTDNVGSEDFNMNLSRERAEAVVQYLVKKGVDRNKLTYSYYGMSRPLTTNDTEEGRAMNRRVEFTILNNF